jgi:hypothetical protein
VARGRAEGWITGSIRNLYLVAGADPPDTATPTGRPVTAPRRPTDTTSAAPAPAANHPAGHRARAVDAVLELARAAVAERAVSRTADQRREPEPEPAPAGQSLGLLGRFIERASENGDLDPRAAVNAAATRRARSKGEPAALPLAGPGLETRVGAASVQSARPVQVSRPTVYYTDPAKDGQPLVRKR